GGEERADRRRPRARDRGLGRAAARRPEAARALRRAAGARAAGRGAQAPQDQHAAREIRERAREAADGPRAQVEGNQGRRGQEMTRVRLPVVVLSLLVFVTSAVAYAQRGRRQDQRTTLGVDVQGNTPYDGRFVFVRLSYPTPMGRYRWIGDG